ncbi:hypothetical protein [Streptomyces sp. NBC_00388]|uniref:hypothetical protein n=1 Tax=Streptomyces sp. NBC_00388 TaxID=2975735 RepID=UPI002E2226A9
MPGVRALLGGAPDTLTGPGELPGPARPGGPDTLARPGGGDAPPVPEAPISDAPAPDTPVFVDASGRRGRKYRRIGWLVALACASYAALLVSTVVGGSSTAPWLLIPGPADGKKADSVRDPAEPVASPAPGEQVPGATAAPVPVDAASTGAPRPATAVSHGVWAAPVPAGPRAAPSRTPGAPGKPRRPAPPVPVPGSSADPAPVSAPPSGGGHLPSPSAPAPSGSATAPAGPEQSAPSESTP